MSNIVENMNLNPELVKNVDPDLQPTKKRIMGPLSYAASFMGGCVSIGTFSMGAGLIGALTVGQAILAMVIGCLVIAVALVIIGNCGHKYGIPYTVQLRSSFGTTGVKVPGLLRGIPAIIWFGFQSWVGAGAINSCLSILFGFSNLPLVYALFTMLQVALAIKDLRVSSGWKIFPVYSSSQYWPTCCMWSRHSSQLRLMTCSPESREHGACLSGQPPPPSWESTQP